MKINDFFQKGYYINLDRRTDRNELFIQEMQRAGLSGFFERFSACDGIVEPDLMKRHAYCGLSYYKLFKKIKAQGLEHVLIFEDDAYFYDGHDTPGLTLVENALNELQNFPDWDMIYFGGMPIESMDVVSKTLCRANTILSTHAVGYKINVIEKVLRDYVPFADSAIDGWYGQDHSLIKYLVNPVAVPQRSISSDLDSKNFIVEPKHYIDCYNRVTKRYVNQ